ncbi:hypothetical protein [Plastorhodobacter daqingensis]
MINASEPDEQGLHLRPGLATDRTQEGNAWTLRLGEGIRFHNGETMTAEHLALPWRGRALGNDPRSSGAAVSLPQASPGSSALAEAAGRGEICAEIREITRHHPVDQGSATSWTDG